MRLYEYVIANPEWHWLSYTQSNGTHSLKHSACCSCKLPLLVTSIVCNHAVETTPGSYRASLPHAVELYWLRSDANDTPPPLVVVKSDEWILLTLDKTDTFCRIIRVRCNESRLRKVNPAEHLEKRTKFLVSL